MLKLDIRRGKNTTKVVNYWKKSPESFWNLYPCKTPLGKSLGNLMESCERGAWRSLKIFPSPDLCDSEILCGWVWGSPIAVLIANKITELPECVGSGLHKFVRILCAESKDSIIGKSQVITNSLV